MLKLKKLGACFLVLALLLGSVWVMAPDGLGIVVAEEDPWVQYPANSHYYQLTDPMPWLDAEAQAVLWGGHLVTLNSWEEELWIKETFGRYEHLWIGFSDIQEEGTWVWSSGEPVVYTNWDTGEPNNYLGEDVAVMNWKHCVDGDCYGDYWNDMGGGHLRGVVERAVSEVAIDIKPGSYPNSINLGSRGVVPVAVLTTDEFDASTVDPAIVLFAGAHPLRWAMEDVDYDGDLDLIFHFKTQELNLDMYSTEATLTGQTMSGIPIEGTDSVNIVP